MNKNISGTFKSDRKKEKNYFTDNGKTVLVIEDEIVLIEIYKMMLERLGHKVFEANSGSEGLKLFKVYKNQIDLVISDMDLLEMDEQEIVDKFRKIDDHVKILLTSGGLSSSDEEEVINRGFNGFIKKPYCMNMLSEKMAEILN